MVEFFDAYGRLALTQKLSSLSEGQHAVQLDLEELASGNYFVRFSSGQQQLTNTFVKLR